MLKNTLIIKLKDENWEEQLIEPAQMLAEGKTVAFPTETVYGLGANARDDKAIADIYTAKGRPSDNPLIVHISDLSMLETLVSEIQPYAWQLIDSFWPGPITFVFKKHASVSQKVTGGLDTVAIRMPAHPVALKLIQLSGVPVAAPSANLSGKPSPTIGQYVIEDLNFRVDAIVYGGDCEIGLESTVLDVSGDQPVVLRPGKITKEAIETLVGICEVDPGILSDEAAKHLTPKSPGMKYKHYAPEAQVTVFVGTPMPIIVAMEQALQDSLSQGMKVGIMIFDEDAVVFYKLLENLNPAEHTRLVIKTQGSIKNLNELGRNLFKDLRDFDKQNCDVVYVHGVDDAHIGHAIMNRLRKASEGRIIKV